MKRLRTDHLTEDGLFHDATEADQRGRRGPGLRQKRSIGCNVRAQLLPRRAASRVAPVSAARMIDVHLRDRQPFRKGRGSNA